MQREMLISGILPEMDVDMFHFPSFVYRQDGYELSVVFIGTKIVNN
jgi:hypothetical protein